MPSNTVGTLKKITVDGITFDVMADANITQKNSPFENEGIPTSGGTMQKKTRIAQAAESIAVATNVDEDKLLADTAARTDKYPMSYQTADGSIYRTTGFIIYENRETESGTTTIQMIPSDADGWKLFSA